jgi:predicted nucleic acid-binding protein
LSFVICDTNIFISAFSGFENTIAEINGIGSENILMPSITVMELYRGMRNKEEMEKMAIKIKTYNILHFNEQASRKATELIYRFKLSHGLQIPDAIIAALCITYTLPLFTYNIKDFSFIPDLELFETSI